MRLINQEYVRSVLFGIEDSLVSTTGLVAGVSVGGASKNVVILSGIVAVAIEAVSMGAGEYLSDDALQELDKIKRHKEQPLVSGFLMLTSYLLAGLIPLAPIFIWSYPTSVYCSVLFALIGLFLLGYVKGKILKTNKLRGAFKILIVGGIATVLGVLVGLTFKV
jgi:VIT1/CCC1 family predicted Fe2+/Mn2+ transporter